jgi:hypothetical protein
MFLCCCFWELKFWASSSDSLELEISSDYRRFDSLDCWGWNMAREMRGGWIKLCGCFGSSFGSNESGVFIRICCLQITLG